MYHRIVENRRLQELRRLQGYNPNVDQSNETFDELEDSIAAARAERMALNAKAQAEVIYRDALHRGAVAAQTTANPWSFDENEKAAMSSSYQSTSSYPPPPPASPERLMFMLDRARKISIGSRAESIDGALFALDM